MQGTMTETESSPIPTGDQSAAFVSPAQFVTERAEAITQYGKGKKSKWEVLGMGTIHAGKIGAVRVRDQYGTVGLVAQQYEGAAAGMALSGVVDGYTEAKAA